jgi:hypothetical protein
VRRIPSMLSPWAQDAKNHWKQHQVELCIDEQVRIVGTKDVLEEDADLLVQVAESRGGYQVLVMEKDKSLTSILRWNVRPSQTRREATLARRFAHGGLSGKQNYPGHSSERL